MDDVVRWIEGMVRLPQGEAVDASPASDAAEGTQTERAWGMIAANDNSERYHLGVISAKRALEDIPDIHLSDAMMLAYGSNDPFSWGWMHTMDQALVGRTTV